MKVFLYPYSLLDSNSQNPYISNFIFYLKKEGVYFVNSSSRGNPLFPLLFNFFKADVFIFHWIENVPTYKYGLFQYSYALFSFIFLKLFNKKIVWFMHNKRPHALNSNFQKFASNHLISVISKFSTHIFTHSKEGLVLLGKYSYKANFIMHPTKNRLSNVNSCFMYDLLIWGNISKYKGIVEFLKVYKFDVNLNKLKVKIIGLCNDRLLLSEIKENLTENVDFENRTVDFDELRSFVGKVKFVLIPYKPDSILSSAILMDSLSFGFSVIGPNTSIFSELELDSRICVQTFGNFEDIYYKIQNNVKGLNYKGFLEEYKWESTALRILEIIKS